MNNWKKLFDLGYSLITADENKVPNFAWKKCQETALSYEDFEKNLAKDNTKYIGLVTGFYGVEVIDIDLKVFDSKEKMDEFWDEYLTLLKDNIEDFDNKFIIAKTVNNGYHIIYRCANPEGNKKLAKLKGMTEAVIETRGTGGYVVVYDADYTKISFISKEDREILWHCSKMYNYESEKIISEIAFDKVQKSPWADYNEKTNLWDLVSSEFDIVRKTAKGAVIKRNGAKSTHSGYLYNNNRMYLFSTATIYPAQELISPFTVYTFQNHGGDYKAASRKLFFDGYGSRESNAKIIKIEDEKPKFDYIPFPTDVFPDTIKNYIDEVSNNANYSPDFLSVSVFSTVATVLGRKVQIKINNTWSTSPIFWFSVVGGPGSKKSHPVKFALRPLKELDKNSKEAYDKEMEVYEAYVESDEFDKKQMVEQYGSIKKPKYFQYVVKDATIEAMFYVHEINKNGILLYKDELIGFIKSMGQYKNGAGEDMEQYLSMFDGDEIKKNRVTKEPLLIPDTCVNLIGTIQPDVLSKIPRDNGFLQRFLFTNTDNKIKRFNTNEVDKKIIDAYENFIYAIQKTALEQPETIVYIMSPEARTEFKRVDNYLCNLQEAAETDLFLNQYIEKLKTYMPRFALVISVLNNIEKNQPYAVIEKEDIEKAFLMAKYFINTSKILLYEQKTTSEAREVTRSMTGLTDKEKVFRLLEKGIDKTKIAQEVGISRQTVYNYVKSVK
jgi:hypothetical protein